MSLECDSVDSLHISLFTLDVTEHIRAGLTLSLNAFLKCPPRFFTPTPCPIQPLFFCLTPLLMWSEFIELTDLPMLCYTRVDTASPRDAPVRPRSAGSDWWKAARGQPSGVFPRMWCCETVLEGNAGVHIFFSWAVVRLVSQNIIVISYSIIPQTTQGSETNTASTCFLSAIFWLHSHKGKNNDMSQRFRESLQRQRFKNRPAGSRCLRNTWCSCFSWAVFTFTTGQLFKFRQFWIGSQAEENETAQTCEKPCQCNSVGWSQIKKEKKRSMSDHKHFLSITFQEIHFLPALMLENVEFIAEYS